MVEKKESDRVAKRAFQKALGQYLKQKRVDAGYSQLSIAAAANLNAQFISNIERGVCSVPSYVLKLMADHYEIDRRELIEYLSELKSE